jgi:hypothetical protein
MTATFEKFYRLLARATIGVFLTGLGLLALALVCALLGFSAASGLSSAGASLAYVFGALFSLFVLMSLVGAVIRWLDRRSKINRQGV